MIIHIPTDKIFYFFIFFQFCTSDSEKKIMMEGKVKYDIHLSFSAVSSRLTHRKHLIQRALDSLDPGEHF